MSDRIRPSDLPYAGSRPSGVGFCKNVNGALMWDGGDAISTIGGGSGVMQSPLLSIDFANAQLDDKTQAATLATSAALIVADGFSTQTNTVSTYTDESQIDANFGFGVNFSTGRGILFAPSSDKRELLARDGYVLGCSIGKNLVDINTTVASLIYVTTFGTGGTSGYLGKKTNGGWDCNFPQSMQQQVSIKIAIDDKPASVDFTVVAGGLKTFNWSANGSSLTISETGHTRKVGDYVQLSNGRFTVASGTAPVSGRYCIASIVNGVSWTANRYVTGSTNPNNATCIRGGGATVAGDAAVAVTGNGTMQLADLFLYVDDLEVMATQRQDNPSSKSETPTALAKIVFGGLDTGSSWQGGGTNNNRLNSAFVINRGNVRSAVNQAIDSVGFLGTSFYANAGPSDFMADTVNTPYWFCGQGFAAAVSALAYAVVSNVCTVTENAHTRLQGQTIYVDTTTGLLPPGMYQITSTATNSWTFAVTTADTTGTTRVCGRSAVPTSALDDDSARHDTGVICQVFRTLAKNGYYPDANTNSTRTIGNNRAQSGGYLTDAIKQADFWGNTPDLVFINLGTNEAVGYPGYPVSEFETNYKKLLLKLARQGVKYAVLQTCLSTSRNPTYASAAIEQYIVEINTVIANLVAWAALNTPSLKVGIDDIYTAFGGSSPNPAWFRTNDIHPNCAGSSKMGISAGLAAVRLLS